MAKFLRKPEFVEAFQWFPGVQNDNVSFYNPGDYKTAWVGTDYGPSKISPGDWIITLKDGKNRIVSDDFLRENYIPVRESDLP